VGYKGQFTRIIYRSIYTVTCLGRGALGIYSRIAVEISISTLCLSAGWGKVVKLILASSHIHHNQERTLALSRMEQSILEKSVMSFSWC
jgi:hypothetical protein